MSGAFIPRWGPMMNKIYHGRLTTGVCNAVQRFQYERILNMPIRDEGITNHPYNVTDHGDTEQSAGTKVLQ